ncbi:hypothetical protein, partial [Arcticibacter tournemirensis]|uniref:hypothetical protein n=1 Tax=Arcticibacter tournemirensis TaxID=699437 RepID=UPI001F3E0E81
LFHKNLKNSYSLVKGKRVPFWTPPFYYPPFLNSVSLNFLNFDISPPVLNNPNNSSPTPVPINSRK